MAGKLVHTVALTLALATCAGDPVAFYNPASGAISECVAGDSDPFLDQCIATYQKSGWVRMTGPIVAREKPPVTTTEP